MHKYEQIQNTEFEKRYEFNRRAAVMMYYFYELNATNVDISTLTYTHDTWYIYLYIIRVYVVIIILCTRKNNNIIVYFREINYIKRNEK